MNVTRGLFLTVCVCSVLSFGRAPTCAEDRTGKKQSASESPPVFSVRGTVVDEKGSPVANVEVVDVAITRRLATLAAAAARTDAAGNFTLNFPARRYGVTLLAREITGGRLAFLERSWSRRSGEAPLRVVLRKPREIAVTVTDGKGHSVAGVKVGVGWDQYSPLKFQQTTGADGKADLHVPSDMPVARVVAVKRGAGLDYFLYRTAGAANGRLGGMGAANWGWLPPFDGKPIEFVLGGVQKVRVHVVDRHRRPLAGIPLGATFQRAGRGGSFNTYSIDELHVTTDRMGTAELDTIPVEAEKSVTVSSGTSDYHFPDKPKLNLGEPTSELTVLALRQPVLRIRVTFPDGRPASAAEVSLTFRHYGGGRHRIGHGFCDADGAFDDLTFPFGAHCVVTASSGHFASPMVACIAHPEEQMAPVNLILQPACRVYGTVTAGKEHRPVPDETFTLYQRDDGQSKQPESQRTANHPELVSEDIPHLTSADAGGRFEFYAAPGRYNIVVGQGVVYRRLIGPNLEERQVRWGDRGNEFRILDQREIEIPLHQDRISNIVIDGRVVMKSEPQRAVPNAIVQGFSTDIKHPVHIKAVCGATGKFQADTGRRDLQDMLIGASTKDSSLSGIVRVKADNATIVIPVEPAVSVRGTLIDAATGRPAINRQIDCGVRINYPGQRFELAFRRNVKTNQKGEFELDGLASGWTFSLFTRIDQTPVLTKWSHVADVTPKNSAPIDLGDIEPGTSDQK